MASSSMRVCIAALVAGFVTAQRPTGQGDNHPSLKTWRCSNADGCVEHTNYIVIDQILRPVYQEANGGLCGAGSDGRGAPPLVGPCPSKEECAQNCVMESIDNYAPYGIETQDDALTLFQLVNGTQTAPRVYLLDEDKHDYEMIKLTGAEFTFDVDASKLPCGINSALYMSEMHADGGRSELNPAGASFGTGYCDAQCPTLPFINGEGNVETHGSCCGELDIWEANSRAVHIAPHPCNITQLYECRGAECGRDGVCDKPGCAWNPYRVAQDDYYGRGPGFRVDTTRPFTVITTFPANEDGNLVEIHRSYVQDGRLIISEIVNNANLPQVNYLDDDFCIATSGATAPFSRLGGHKAMGDAMSRGMVLAMSIWWAEGGGLEWLDGAAQGAGPCLPGEGGPENIVKVEPNPYVTYSNLRWGEIGSTWKASCQVPPKNLALF